MNKRLADHERKPARISVAMATYNGEKYIREQLESLARQSLLPCELIVTDDGSSDATLQIVEDFATAAPFPVRVYRNEKRLGYADNFFKAAALCEGDLIALCDQDDIWMKEKLSVCAGYFVDREVMLAAHSAVTLLDSGETGYVFPRFRRNKVLRIGTVDPFDYPYGFVQVVRKQLVEIKPPLERPNKLVAHDQWFWLIASSLGKIAIIKDVLTHYRQHGGNLFGAPEQPTLLHRARRIARTVHMTNFDHTAEAELACSRILRNAAETQVQLSSRLRRAAQRLELRARFHKMRTEIYSLHRGSWRKAIVFARMLFSGGYLPDRSGTRVGLLRGVKDFLLGVCGVHKLFGTASIGKSAESLQ